MYGLLRAFEDNDRSRQLCFATKEDATRFKEFVNIYMDDSGAGNGYGAYWVMFDEPVIGCDAIPCDVTATLHYPLLKQMIDSVMKARLAGRNHGKTIGFTVGIYHGAMTFSYESFPPRLVPTQGDMFRVPRSLRDKDQEMSITEGRVWRDLGDELEVYHCFDEGKDGQPEEGCQIVRIPKASTMKINDWLAEHRGR